jgi:hypothetical protein
MRAGEKIGHLAQELIELLENEVGEDVMVGTVVIACDVLTDTNPVASVCTDSRYWVRAALLSKALDEAEDKERDREEQALAEDDD